MNQRFDRPDRFVAGTVGLPGERTFYLQVSEGSRTVSIALEKTQVAILAEQIDRLLAEVADAVGVPGDPEGLGDDNAPLDTPVEEAFRAGAMTLRFTPEDSMIDVVLADSGEDEAENEVTVRLTADGARAFARRAHRVVAAGRPPCPLCGAPMDVDGHVCPRQNGHRH